MFLKRWADTHPDARPLQIVFRGGFRPESLVDWDGQTEYRGMPEIRAEKGAPRWFAISVGKLYDRILTADPYTRFRGRVPDAMAGYSIYLYRLENDTSQPRS